MVLLLVLAVSQGRGAAEEADAWQTEKSTHFIVHYSHASLGFVRKVIDNAERYYNAITNDMGFIRYDFWAWENRANIFIHDDAQRYQAVTGQPPWSLGIALPREKIIHTYPCDEDFFNTLLPHEMGHIIFREFVGFDNAAVPEWLDEGIASYQEAGRRSFALDIVQDAVETGRFIDLATLSALNPQLIRDPQAVTIFYAESVTVIQYLMKKYGREKFVYFCQLLRDDRDITRALRMSYGIESMQKLSEGWESYVKSE